jgi:hypothetical protein
LLELAEGLSPLSTAGVVVANLECRIETVDKRGATICDGAKGAAMRPATSLDPARRLAPFAVAIAGLLACGCCKPGGSKDYYPLTPGMKWEYLASGALTHGAIVSVGNMPPSQMAGRTVTPRRSEASGKSSYDYVSSDVDGVCSIASQRVEDSAPRTHPSPRCMLRSPIKVGTRWQTDSETAILDRKRPVSLLCTLESEKESVALGSAKYDKCAFVKCTGSTYGKTGLFGTQQGTIQVTDQSWYAPGVGLVKAIRTENNLGVGLELLSVKK